MRCNRATPANSRWNQPRDGSLREPFVPDGVAGILRHHVTARS